MACTVSGELEACLRELREGEGELGTIAVMLVRDRVDDRRERRAAGDQRSGEQHHQEGGLGKEADEHLAPRSQRTEGGADVHGR